MRKSRFFRCERRDIKQEQTLLPIIVKRGRLFGQQIDGRFLQVEVGRHQPEQLQRQFVRIDFFRLKRRLHAVRQKLSQLRLRHAPIGNGMLFLQARDVG